MEGQMCWGSKNDPKWPKVVNASIDYFGHFWMKIRPSGVLLLNRDGGQKWQKCQKGVTPKIPPFFTFFEILKRAYRRIRDWDHRMSGSSKSGSKSVILGPPKSENRPFCIIFDPPGGSKMTLFGQNGSNGVISGRKQGPKMTKLQKSVKNEVLRDPLQTAQKVATWVKNDPLFWQLSVFWEIGVSKALPALGALRCMVQWSMRPGTHGLTVKWPLQTPQKCSFWPFLALLVIWVSFPAGNRDPKWHFCQKGSFWPLLGVSDHPCHCTLYCTVYCTVYPP